MQLRAGTGSFRSGVASFLDAATFRFDLPQGLVVTSDSGVFMTAVPEPSAWLLALVGLGTVGVAQLRLRRARVAHPGPSRHGSARH